jgi:hypothetical protein
LQRQLKALLKGNFEFRRNRNGTKIVTKEITDFSTIRSHFGKNNVLYITYYPKSHKLVEIATAASIYTPAEDISDGLVDLGLNVITVKQKSATHRSPEGRTFTVDFPFFLITLPGTSESQGIFELTGFCHIPIMEEAYKVQTVLMQCYIR